MQAEEFCYETFVKRFQRFVGLILGLTFLWVSPVILAADLTWLNPSSISVQSFLAAPPKPGSSADQEDLKRVLEYQTSRTEADCKRARAEMNDTLANLFGSPYGPLNDSQIEKFSPLYATLHAETKYFVDELKKQWNRPRPQQADSRVNPCVRTKSLQAYPSGHTAVALLFAEVMAHLKPEMATAVKIRAEQIAEDRVLAGAHRPADIAAGKKLGVELARQLLSNPQFRQELNNLQDGPL